MLLEGFRAAKQAALERIADNDASSLPVPLQHGWMAEMRTLMGPELWPYGLAPNRPVLERFGALMQAQGLTARQLSPEEVFPSG